MEVKLTLGQATIGIVTALPKEQAAVHAVFSPTVSAAGASGTVYDLCEIPCIEGRIVVAVTLLPEMGNNLAAALTTRMLLDCEHIQDVMMVGIAGAFPCPSDPSRHVRLGDLVVSGKNGAFQFDFGKRESGKPFQHRSIPTRPSSLLSSAVKRLISFEEIGKRPWEIFIENVVKRLPDWHRPAPNTDVLDDGIGEISHPDDPTRRPGFPRVFVGAIASSNTLLKDSEKRDAIAGFFSNIGGVPCCVEMEAAGVQDATWVDNAGFLIVRGTCDYCNLQKNDTWQKYAALIAAAFARSVVEELPCQTSSNSTSSMPSAKGPPVPQSFGDITDGSHISPINISNSVVNLQLCPKFRHPECLETAGPAIQRTIERQRNLDSAARKIHQLLMEIRDALKVWNYDLGAAAAQRLDPLLVANADRLSEALFLDGTVLSARVHINRAETKSVGMEIDIELAKILLKRAELSIKGTNSDRLAEIRALRASIKNLVRGSETALSFLNGCNDPYAVRTRVALLLSQQKASEAVRIFEALDIHERWCDLAVTAYTANDQIGKAQAIVQWAMALSDRSRYYQCIVRLADAMMARALADHATGSVILPHEITPQEHEKIEIVAETLVPVIQTIQTAGNVASELEMTALRIAWHVNHLLQRRRSVVELMGLMAQWSPLPLDFARGVVMGYIDSPSDLPDRIRQEHPGNLDASILAAVIQSGSFGQHKAAFAKAKELLPLADNDEKKEDLFKLIIQLWQNVEDPEVSECEAIAESLVTHKPRLQAIFDASITLRKGNPDRAITILDKEKSEDDPYWLQVRANALLQKRQLAEATKFLFPAAKKIIDAELFHKTGDIAFQAEKHEIAIWCYEKLTEIHPDNQTVRSNLAHIYTFLKHDLEKAAVHFRALRRIEPTNQKHTFNLAICLAQLFHPEESLRLYDELCSHSDPAIQAILGRAQLHHSMGKPERAMVALEPFRKRFLSDPRFLMTYITTAYAAGNDDKAHEAFISLNRLLEEGAVKPEVFRMVHKDEILEMFKQSSKQTRQRDESLHSEMLKGRMPWIWKEQASNNTIYMGWRSRTQELAWIGDEPTNRARYSIYSTNGFHTGESEEGKNTLLSLKCPPTGTKIVADISALITLHRLELLDLTVEYFDEVILPAGYLPMVLEDSRQMVLSQRSQKQSFEQIKRQVDEGRITVLSDGTETTITMPIVDEYADQDTHHYRLKDMIRPLYSSGFLPEEDFDRISRIIEKPSAVDATHPELEQFQNVIVDLTTLKTVAHFGLLDAVSGFYKIHVTGQEHRATIQDLNAIAYQEETRQWHINLWTWIRSDSRFKFMPHVIPKALRKNDRDTQDYLPFLATFLAQETKRPLLADDRVCQVFTRNQMADVPHAAFGTDVVILALMNAGRLDSETAANAIRKLMSWRYRFIVPSPTILKVIADPYRKNPPGQAFKDVAEYLHDCMRDSGLFGGPEKTELGESMAMRLYLAWISNIAEFLVLVWADEGFTPEAAVKLTEWSCGRLLPSCPRVVDSRMKVRVSEMTSRLFLSHALIQTANHYDEPRMADAIKAIKEALRLSDDEYLQLVTGILNDSVRTVPKA
jgi:nucleoside phosphorylase/tetratricopeptide (TPR) repeat protein